LRHHHFELRHFIPTLRTLGVAAQHLPRYTNNGWGPLSHDILYCSFIARGQAKHRVGDDEYLERAGSLTVVGYGVPHEILTDGRCIDHYNLYLDPVRHPLPRLDLPLERALYRLFPLNPALLAHGFHSITHVKVPNSRRLTELLRAIEDEQRSDTDGRDAALTALLELVLIEIARAVSCTHGPLTFGGADDPDMEEVRRRFDERFAEAWSMARLARDVGLTPEHFSRRFSRYAGCSPMAYLKSRRLHAAMAGLRSTDTPIVDVAEAAGFFDLAYFNRTFRAVLGVTPGAYRKRFCSRR
jgi:AraC-like DNA-binding protein